MHDARAEGASGAATLFCAIPSRVAPRRALVAVLDGKGVVGAIALAWNIAVMALELPSAWLAAHLVSARKTAYYANTIQPFGNLGRYGAKSVDSGDSDKLGKQQRV